MIARRVCASLVALGVVFAGAGLASTSALADIQIWTPERASTAQTRSVLIWTVPEAGEPAVPRGFDDQAPKAGESDTDVGTADVPQPTKYPKSLIQNYFRVFLPLRDVW